MDTQDHHQGLGDSLEIVGHDGLAGHDDLANHDDLDSHDDLPLHDHLAVHVAESAQFPQFADLPIELRLAIWAEATKLPRIVHVDPAGSIPDEYRQPCIIFNGNVCEQVPVLFMVNSESRGVAVKVPRVEFTFHCQRGAFRRNHHYVIGENDIVSFTGNWLKSAPHRWSGQTDRIANIMVAKRSQDMSWTLAAHAALPGPFSKATAYLHRREGYRLLFEKLVRQASWSILDFQNGNKVRECYLLVHDGRPLWTIKSEDLSQQERGREDGSDKEKKPLAQWITWARENCKSAIPKAIANDKTPWSMATTDFQITTLADDNTISG